MRLQLRSRSTTILLAFGGNVCGAWGLPGEAIDRALAALESDGLSIVARSHNYATTPHGLLRQPRFVNAVAEIRGSIAPAPLLRLVKAIERRAGRRPGPRNGPRPLDIDILAMGGRRSGPASGGRQAGRLSLPHPLMETRGFVLVPLAEAAPHWRHPGSGLTAAEVLRRNPRLRRGVVRLE